MRNRVIGQKVWLETGFTSDWSQVYYWEVNWPRFFSNRDYVCARRAVIIDDEDPKVRFTIKNGSFQLSPEVFNFLCKVPGSRFHAQTVLANKPSPLQIFPHSKFGINRTAASKVMAKKYNFGQRNFLAITFKPVHIT